MGRCRTWASAYVGLVEGELHPVNLAWVAAATIYGVIGTVLSTTFGAITDDPTLAVGTILATVIGFATLLIKSMHQNQDAIWRIVKDQRERITELEDEGDYKDWRYEKLLYDTGRRLTDPGDFELRKRREVVQ